jgi:DNA gyrase subunit A
MGVVFARPGDDDRIIAIARNGERSVDVEQPVEPIPTDIAESTPVTPTEESSDA